MPQSKGDIEVQVHASVTLAPYEHMWICDMTHITIGSQRVSALMVSRAILNSTIKTIFQGTADI
jgi:hypothetical protein